MLVAVNKENKAQEENVMREELGMPYYITCTPHEDAGISIINVYCKL